MPRVNNLKGKEHKLTFAERSRGGKTVTLEQKLAKRIHCNSQCPIFDSCPLSAVGVKYDTCYFNKKRYPRMYEKVSKLFSDNPNDLYDVASEVLGDMVRIVDSEDDSNPKTKKIVMNAINQLHDMKFGSKHNVDVGNKDGKPFKFEFEIVENES